MGDILQDIPDEDVPLLRNLYKDHQNEAPYVYSLLNTYMVWKNKKPNLNCISLFGVNDDWLKTGTFILLFEYACNNSLVIYTLEDDCQTLIKSLTQTTRIDWEKRTIWSPVMAIHIPVVYNILRELDKWPRKITTDKMWMLDREKALQLEIQYSKFNAW
ncbi:hypothetical protein MML48_2g00003611 [Holotrichia oblita]|uniref:Uncharacterized protein n=1 Tax=Holotrichia oblita TaxID=644536 RepID=A0ACB9TQU9_HOLOL|nr:hypothetical protein MML48_2g00003611 [Holotrichia oblita]